jgi:hypothetical protein
VLVMLVWIDWLNVFILKSHQCALLYLKYIIEHYISIFIVIRMWSSTMHHSCIHRAENIHFSGKKCVAFSLFI